MTKITCAVLRCQHNHNFACTLHEVKIRHAANKLMMCANYEPDNDEITKWDISSGIPRLGKEE
jgi:hypothetical protein